MSAPINDERPFLNKIIDLQKLTSELDLNLHKQISGEIIDNKASMDLIDQILLEVETLNEEHLLDNIEQQYLLDFDKEIRRLKVALIYYKKNRIYDSASSSTEELFEIIDEGLIEINKDLHSIISIIRSQISKSDETVLSGTRFIQKGLAYFLSLIIIGTMIILFFFNETLSANLKKLMTGTKELGAGNFEWRIQSKFNDEFGQLSAAFNEMAKKLAASRHEIFAQTEEINRLAYYDSLTKLPNRNAFMDKLKQEVSRAKRNDEKISVLYVDLDDFKMVNDAFGHEMGDFLLKEAAERLRKSTRLSDTVARLAGDEFAIILTHLDTYVDSSSSDIGQRILAEISCPVSCSNRIIEEMSQPFTIQNHTISMTSSIGIAVYPENGSTATELLNNADTAMYVSKSEGKNLIKFCTEEMTQKMRTLVDIEHDIRQSLRDGDFVLNFQPQVDLATKNIIGLEALIRWNHPQRGVVPPGDFIPIAENRGIIQDISKWVIREVFDQIKRWRAAGCRLIPVMVNISARDFFQQGIENYIVNILKEEKEVEGLFGVEVTETSIMDDRENAIGTLNRLQNMGVKIALDDFGTGFSSMNYLQFLPLDMVKIDRSFIKNITQNSKNAAITEAIISMSHALNLKVLAEGIETPEQHEFVCKIQCDQAQGYLFYKPLPADEISKLLSESSG